MSDDVKVIGLIVSGLVSCAFGIVGAIYGLPILLNLCYAFGGIFGALLGLPFVARAVRKIAGALGRLIQELAK